MDAQDDRQKNGVEDIPTELQVKHPLEHNWTLWYYESMKGKNWLECIHRVYDFETVEDFWCLYNYIKPVDELPRGSDYYMFKSGIQPMWEDEQNKHGGKWLFNVEVSLYNYIKPVDELTHGSDYYLFKTGIQPMWEDEKNKYGGKWLLNWDIKYKQHLNHLWLNTMLYMIGELFDELGEDICGSCINIRGKGDKINLWTGDATKKDNVIQIGEILKKSCYKLPSETKLNYESHADSQSKANSRAKYLYQV